ncbi:MAG: MBL fold metallo-hydrolase [Bacteroidota bacterium]
MEIEFHGAARTVTGSMHLLQVGKRRLLLDCGLYQGHRDEARRINSEFPFAVDSINAVVLSHAHIDHTGNLPGLVRQGYRGPVYCTNATKDLLGVMLRDSAFIQERDVEFISKRHRRKGLPPVTPLYTRDDVEETLPLLQGFNYSAAFDVLDGVSCRYEDAGHILGSASLMLTLRENGSTVKFAFTGDLGRSGLPILRDPVFIGADADVLLTESTYGGRLHAPVQEMEHQLLEPILRAAGRKGKIIIPGFSVGRTQELVYVLHNLSAQGKIPYLPVFVDSPLSVNVTDVFRKHPECYDDETLAILHSRANNDPFGFERLTYIRDVEHSKELNDRPGPFIVIAASGMCDNGRIVHHLANSIEDPRNMVIIAGYQAENTLGKKLVMKQPIVNIFGEPHELRAEVVVLNSFSGHADRTELLGYIGKFDRKRLKKIFVVHGDPDQSEKLAGGLQNIGFGDVHVPSRGDRATLN